MVSLRILFAVLVAGTLTAFAAPGASASGRDLWLECRDTGTVGANHSPQDYADAIANPPADGSEYTPCMAAIKSGQLQAAQRASGAVPPRGEQRSGAPDEGRGKPHGRAAGDPAAQADGATDLAPGVGVAPAALDAALQDDAVDPFAQPEATPTDAPPAELGGKAIPLADAPAPSLARTLSLPLPLAASALVVLLAALLPVARAVAARIDR